MGEPITLTDPDGAVTRLAPSSSWTREQVRAPGGEPALVTRLESGQLWFASGRRRSPWRHEVQVGAATVSTPQGRFHAIAETDGGATVVCQAGRARVVTGLGDPVLLNAEESAAISSDGGTLVVMDRGSATAGAGALTPDPEAAPARSTSSGSETGSEAAGDEPGAGDQGPAGLVAVAPAGRRARRRWEWIPELTAVAAVIALLVALALWVVGGRTSNDVAAPVPTTAATVAPPTTRRPGTAPSTAPTRTTRPRTTTSAAPATTTSRRPATTTTRPATTSTAPPATTTAPPATTTVTARPVAPGASAVGELVGCRRVGGGVEATVELTHRAGGASPFEVTVALVDAGDDVFAQAKGRSASLQPASRGRMTVTVPVAGRVSGACEVLQVVAV